MHAAERHREMMKQAGIEVGKADLSWMESDVSLFGLRAPYVLLVPGSSPAHPEKRWSAMRFGALGLKMMKEGYDVAVLGTAAESEVIARVVKSCPGVRDLSGRTSLYDIATLARGAKAAVGNDTGPTHLIAMAGCPTVVLFSGHSDPAKSAPVGDVIVIQAEDMNDINVPDIYGALRTMEIR
jgi:ADP-heptose:LPS heptosyltransferase